MLVLFWVHSGVAEVSQADLGGGAATLHAPPLLALPLSQAEPEGLGAPKPYEQAQEQSMTVQRPKGLQDAVLLYQLSVISFNAGNTAEAKLRLRQAHALLQFSGDDTQVSNVAELRMAGEYNFIPISKDRWRLHPKSNQTRIYHLDGGALYQMELEHEKSLRSKSLVSIPIGLLLIWVLAR